MRALSRATLLLVAAVSVLAHAGRSWRRRSRLFDQYVALSAAFDDKVADLYADSAHIQNTRRYPDGQSRSMSMPALSYKTLIRQVMPKAKAAGDLSTYSDVRYTPEDGRVRIKRTRYSELKKYVEPVLAAGRPRAGRQLADLRGDRASRGRRRSAQGGPRSGRSRANARTLENHRSR